MIYGMIFCPFFSPEKMTYSHHFRLIYHQSCRIYTYEFLEAWILLAAAAKSLLPLENHPFTSLKKKRCWSLPVVLMSRTRWFLVLVVSIEVVSALGMKWLIMRKLYGNLLKIMRLVHVWGK